MRKHLPLLVAASLVLLLVAWLGVGRSEPTADDPGMLVATFADASPLEIGSQVRASGVRVGTVKEIRLDGKTAQVRIEVDQALLPVHQDATLTVKPVNLLGETYLDLRPGSPEAPRLEGRLPIEQTSSTVTLQDVLNTFDDPTSTGLAALVTTLGQSMDGNGEDIAAALKALAPTMDQATKLGLLLDDQNDVLASLVDRAAPLLEAAAVRDGQSLDDLLAATDRALRTVAEQQDGVERTLKELPSTLSAAQTSLRLLTEATDSAVPTLRSLRPVTAQLPQTAKEIEKFSESADPALKALEPVLEKAEGLVTEAAPLVRSLRRSGDDLVETSRTLDDAGEILLDKRLGDLMSFVREWALSTNGRDGLSHYFRGVLHISPMAVNTLLGLNALPELDVPETKPDYNEPHQQGTSPDKAPGTTEQKGLLEGLLGSLLNPGEKKKSKPGQDKDGATGLDPDQERDLLGSLLGGLL